MRRAICAIAKFSNKRLNLPSADQRQAGSLRPPAAIKKVSRPDFIETIRIPMLIIAAGMDSVVSTPAIERYALQLRNATLLTIDGRQT